MDETDKRREKMAREAFRYDEDVDGAQIGKLMASDSSDDEDEDFRKRKALLTGSNTGGSDVFGKSRDFSPEQDEGFSLSEKWISLDDEEDKSKESDEAAEKKPRKKKMGEWKKRKEEEEGMTSKGKKRRNGKSFAADIDDPRFEAIYADPAFNIELSDAKFKRTEGMDRILQKKANLAESRERRKPKR